MVIATLDTGSRRWNYEVIPEGRVERAWERACRRLDALDHYEALAPTRTRCPNATSQRPIGSAAAAPTSTPANPAVRLSPKRTSRKWKLRTPSPTTTRKRRCVEYEQVQRQLKSLDTDKRSALKTLQHWLQRKGEPKARLEGREKTCTVGMVTSRRYAVDHKRLNALLESDVRAEIVTEQTSEYLRVS